MVRRCTADLSEALKLQFKCEEVTAVWKALRQCGLKQQITWEDAMAEARHIESTHNQKLSKILFGHLEAVPAMAGDKSHCLKILHQLEWVVVHIPPSTANKKPTESGSTLASLRNVFPAGESKFVWAVESTLNEDGALLKAGRSVQREPRFLFPNWKHLLEQRLRIQTVLGLGILFGACLSHPPCVKLVQMHFVTSG